MKKRQGRYRKREKEKETLCTRFHCLKRVSLRFLSLSAPFFLAFHPPRCSFCFSLYAPYASIFSLAHFYSRQLAASLQVLFSGRYDFCLRAPRCSYEAAREWLSCYS